MTADYPIIKGLDQKIRAFVSSDEFFRELAGFLGEKNASILIEGAPTYIRSNAQGDIDEDTIARYVADNIVWMGDSAVGDLLAKGNKEADAAGEAYDNVAKHEAAIIDLFLQSYRVSIRK